MNTTITRNEKNIIIAVEGRIDTMTSPSLSTEIESVTSTSEENANWKLLQIDFKKVDYISSAGLRLMLITLKSVKKLNRELKLIHVKKDVFDVFKMTGFDKMLNMELEEA